MNNRILELAKQAGIKASSETFMSPQENLFAELIVRECADLIDSMEHSSQYFPHVADAIKEHFEIEARGMKCLVKDCANHGHEGGFVGDLCVPCYQFITTGEGVYSQAYRNTAPKELNEVEILELWTKKNKLDGARGIIEFARAILKKASEQ